MLQVRSKATLTGSGDVCWRMLTYADVCWRMLREIKAGKAASTRLPSLAEVSCKEGDSERGSERRSQCQKEEGLNRQGNQCCCSPLAEDNRPSTTNSAGKRSEGGRGTQRWRRSQCLTIYVGGEIWYVILCFFYLCISRVELTHTHTHTHTHTMDTNTHTWVAASVSRAQEAPTADASPVVAGNICKTKVWNKLIVHNFYDTLCVLQIDWYTLHMRNYTTYMVFYIIPHMFCVSTIRKIEEIITSMNTTHVLHIKH